MTSFPVTASQLPITSRRSLTPADTSLVNLAHTQAAFIWVTEDQVPGQAPPLAQRAFRRTYNVPSGNPAPSNLTILLAADDDYALYVNGVLVHPADGSHDDDALDAFSIPLPVIEQEDNKAIVICFRVVNLVGGAGLLGAVQVNYPGSTAPDIFYTGSDPNWLGERLFQEHWEQPWFESMPEFSTWRPAVVWNKTARDPANSRMIRDEVVELGRLPALSDLASSSCPSCSAVSTGGEGSGRKGSGISGGALAGGIVGSLLLGLLIGWLVSRKKYKQSGNRANEIGGAPPLIYEPASELSYARDSYQPPSGPAPLYQPAAGGATSSYQPSSAAATGGGLQDLSPGASPTQQPETRPGRR
ncbi:hypothetical protein DFP72DRAFT_867906, partial [Ephemerocybe angulata]